MADGIRVLRLSNTSNDDSPELEQLDVNDWCSGTIPEGVKL